MIGRMTLRSNDERGASLILTLGFVVIAGLVTAAILNNVTSAMSDRATLDRLRNREYDADAAIEAAIAQARSASGPILKWAAASTSLTSYLTNAQCGGSYVPNAVLNQFSMRVDCTPAPTLLRITNTPQFDVIFSAVCTASGCPATPVIRAEIDFAVSGGAVTRAYVESWSVNS
jgi:hypothetical protein